LNIINTTKKKGQYEIIHSETETRYTRTKERNACQIMMFAADFDEINFLKYAKVYFRCYDQTVKIRAATTLTIQNGLTINTSVNESIVQDLLLAKNYIADNPWNVTNNGDKSDANSDENRALVVLDMEKNKTLFEILDAEILDAVMPSRGQVLVFIEQIRDVRNLYKVLSDQSSEHPKWNIGYIHRKCSVSSSK